MQPRQTTWSHSIRPNFRSAGDTLERTGSKQTRHSSCKHSQQQSACVGGVNCRLFLEFQFLGYVTPLNDEFRHTRSGRTPSGRIFDQLVMPWRERVPSRRGTPAARKARTVRFSVPLVLQLLIVLGQNRFSVDFFSFRGYLTPLNNVFRYTRRGYTPSSRTVDQLVMPWKERVPGRRGTPAASKKPGQLDFRSAFMLYFRGTSPVMDLDTRNVVALLKTELSISW